MDWTKLGKLTVYPWILHPLQWPARMCFTFEPSLKLSWGLLDRACSVQHSPSINLPAKSNNEKFISLCAGLGLKNFSKVSGCILFQTVLYSRDCRPKQYPKDAPCFFSTASFILFYVVELIYLASQKQFKSIFTVLCKSRICITVHFFLPSYCQRVGTWHLHHDWRSKRCSSKGHVSGTVGF